MIRIKMAHQRKESDLNVFPTHLYYDLSIKSQYSDGVNDRVTPLTFSEERSNPLVAQANLYKLSIVRFSLDTMSLPVWRAEIQPGSTQTDPNLMIQAVNIDYDDGVGTITTVAPTHLVFTRRDHYDAVPPAPSANPPHYIQTFDTGYYNSYSIAHIVDTINVALQTAQTAINAAVGATLAGVHAPVCYWNGATDKLEIHSRSDIFEESLTAKCRIHFSKSLYALFPNFDVEKNSYTVANKKHYRIISRSHSGQHVLSNFFGAFSAVKTEQEYPDLATLCPYASLVFTTTSIPVVHTALSAPYLMQDNNLIQIFGNVNNQQAIISDLISQDYSYRSNLLYTPSGENRYLTLTGNGELRHIDIQVWMKEKTGRLTPFFLHGNSSASMKILFQKHDT